MTISSILGRVNRFPAEATPRSNLDRCGALGLGAMRSLILLLALPLAVHPQDAGKGGVAGAPGGPAGPDSAVRSFVGGLPMHPGVDRELARFRDGALPAAYREEFAQVARQKVEERLLAEVQSIAADGCSDRSWVEFPGKGFSGASPSGDVQFDFENSLVLSGLVACFPTDADPDSVLGVYVAPETRMAAQSRLREVFQQDGLSCYRVDGVRFLLSASMACNDVHRLRGPVVAEHSQSVVSEAEDKQPVYFKESLKAAFSVEGGVALVHVNLTRTTGLNGLEKRVGRGAIEDTLRRQAELVSEALAAAGS